MTPSDAHRRGPWSTMEDDLLLSFVGQSQPLNWVRIAQQLHSRTPKQCRERYHQNLKPSLNHLPISPEEGSIIERCVAEGGKRWADIARRLNGRSDNAVKNWWNGNQNRQRRRLRNRGMPTSQRPSNDDPFGQQQGHNSGSYHTGLQLREVPRALPEHTTHNWARNAPAPLTLQARGSYETPLPSPAGLASPTPSRHTPSLVSDGGSSYTYSPQQQHPPSPLEAIRLPPIHASGECAPQHQHQQPADRRLPPLHLLEPSEPSAARPFVYGNVRGQQSLPPLPSPHKVPAAEHQQQQSGLPTAPNSPVGETQQAAPSRPGRSAALSIHQMINAPESQPPS